MATRLRTVLWEWGGSKRLGPLGVLVPISGVSASPIPQADEYPLTIPPDFDASQCTTCHSDKTQGKYVRSAMAMGRTTCHTSMEDLAPRDDPIAKREIRNWENQA